MMHNTSALGTILSLTVLAGIGGCDTDPYQSRAHDGVADLDHDRAEGIWSVSVEQGGSEFAEHEIDGELTLAAMGALEAARSMDAEHDASEASFDVVVAFDDVEVANLSFPGGSAGVRAVVSVLRALRAESEDAAEWRPDELVADPDVIQADCDLCEEAGGVCCAGKCKMRC